MELANDALAVNNTSTTYSGYGKKSSLSSAKQKYNKFYSQGKT